MRENDLLRDFGRADVRDTLHNRAARAAFFHSTPGRLMMGLEELPDDVDDAIDETDFHATTPSSLKFAMVVTGLLLLLAAIAQVNG